LIRTGDAPFNRDQMLDITLRLCFFSVAAISGIG
jgi:hypothetical protein